MNILVFVVTYRLEQSELIYTKADRACTHSTRFEIICDKIRAVAWLARVLSFTPPSACRLSRFTWAACRTTTTNIIRPRSACFSDLAPCAREVSFLAICFEMPRTTMYGVRQQRQQSRNACPAGSSWRLPFHRTLQYRCCAPLPQTRCQYRDVLAAGTSSERINITSVPALIAQDPPKNTRTSSLGYDLVACGRQTLV